MTALEQTDLHSRKKDRIIFIAAITAAVLCISTAALFFKMAAPTHPLVMSAARLLIASAALSPFVFIAWREGRFTRRIFYYAVLSGVIYAAHFGAWVTSLTLTNTAASVTLVTTTPIMLAAIGAATGRDKPSGGLWASIAAAFIGLLLIGKSDLTAEGALAGDALALLGAFAIVFYMLIVRLLGSSLKILAFNGAAAFVGALLLFAAAAAFGVEIKVASPRSLAFLALAAIFPQVIGHSLLTWCLRSATPTEVSMAVVGEAALATLLTAAVLGESVKPEVAAGCAITLASVGAAVYFGSAGKKAVADE